MRKKVIIIGILVAIVSTTSIWHVSSAKEPSIKYSWFEMDRPTIQELEKVLGIDIDSIKIGAVGTGDYYLSYEEGIGEIQVPETKRGIEITFKSQPSSAKLNQCDRTLEKLGLTREINELEVSEVPFSDHYAALISVTPTATKPVKVARLWMGEVYQFDCLATQTVVDLWLAGEIQVYDPAYPFWHPANENSLLVVSFIDENPKGTKRNVPIVIGKVYPSWN